MAGGNTTGNNITIIIPQTGESYSVDFNNAEKYLLK
jgi:hypothetical protein